MAIDRCWLHSNAPTAYNVMPPLVRLTIHFYPATQYNPIPPPRKSGAGYIGLLQASPRSSRQTSTRRNSGKVPNWRSTSPVPHSRRPVPPAGENRLVTAQCLVESRKTFAMPTFDDLSIFNQCCAAKGAVIDWKEIPGAASPVGEFRRQSRGSVCEIPGGWGRAGKKADVASLNMRRRRDSRPARAM